MKFYILRFIYRLLFPQVPRLLYYLYTKDDLRKEGMKIGDNTSFYIDFWCHSEPYLIEIGDNCQITEGVKAFTHGGSHAARCIYPNFDVFGKIKIGNWCYIGNNSLIMPGVIIGENCIVAAGSVVTKSIPAGCVVAGNPARIICSTNDYINRNKIFDFNCKHYPSTEKRKLLMSAPDSHFVLKKFMKS